MSEDNKTTPPPPPPEKSKRELIHDELVALEAKMQVLFGGVHEELAEIVGKIRAHLG